MEYQEAHDKLTEAKTTLTSYKAALAGTSEPDLVRVVDRHLDMVNHCLDEIKDKAGYVWVDATQGNVKAKLNAITGGFTGDWFDSDVADAIKAETPTISGEVYYIDQTVPMLHDLPTKGEWVQLKKEGWDSIGAWMRAMFELNYKEALNVVILETSKDAAQFKLIYG